MNGGGQGWVSVDTIHSCGGSNDLLKGKMTKDDMVRFPFLQAQNRGKLSLQSQRGVKHKLNRLSGSEQKKYKPLQDNLYSYARLRGRTKWVDKLSYNAPVFLFKSKEREEIASVLARAHSPLKSVKNSLFLSQNNLPVTSTILPNKPVDFTSVWCLELGS